MRCAPVLVCYRPAEIASYAPASVGVLYPVGRVLRWCCPPLLKLVLGSQLVLATGLSACQLVLLVLQGLDLLRGDLHVRTLSQNCVLGLQQDAVCPKLETLATTACCESHELDGGER